ncbi:hypothetical protein SSX86_012661 [Deinandra increscens subsp. villosa]|uniref:Uncharacterized protein n=1 Tax=Deinandra increscens subsp. villosa TaxID=3103831 RepID=A0AAP0D4N4_9ASTR
MMIGVVKGRWLDQLEPYPNPTTSMISDGIDHRAMNGHENPRSYLRVGSSMFYGEKRCESIYGFLPCADTMSEGVFLMIMYTYLMMLGEDWIRKGSQALFLLLGDKAIGASVFRVLMALPRIVLVVVAGFISTESAAQNQVALGMSMYAGSTLITLTLIWGIRIILSRDRLRGKGTSSNEHQQDISSWSLKQKLSILNDTGVNIDKETGYIAFIMLLSLIPFAIVELVSLINSRVMLLFALVVSGLSLLLYFAYQVPTTT